MYVWFREESKRILFPEVSYSKVLEDAGLKTLFHRCKELCSTLFKQIVENVTSINWLACCQCETTMKDITLGIGVCFQSHVRKQRSLEMLL